MATATITNTGTRLGKEVVQLYIADSEASIIRPVKELKGFEKVELKPGESTTVTFAISAEDLAFYDEITDGWRVEPGEFRILVGSSSADIRLVDSFIVK